MGLDCKASFPVSARHRLRMVHQKGLKIKPLVQAVLVVAANAKHSSGKMATLCAQAAVGLYKVMMANRIPWYPAFEAQGEKTVVMSASSGADLEKLADIASQGLLPTFLVRLHSLALRI